MRAVVVSAAIVVTVTVVAGVAAVSAPDYQVSVMLPSATNLVPGGIVEIKGFSAGKVSDIEPVDGQAKVTMELDSSYAPLHDGAVGTVRWNSLVGQRHLTITDGPAANIHVPSGGMLKGNMPQPMELDQVLAALDPPTRQRLTGLINNLRQTLNGHEQDLNSTVQSAGPALRALGQVLQGLGTDGPAISALVTQVEQMVSTLSNRDGQVRDIVDRLSTLSGNVVQQRQALGQVLQKLPDTLR